MFQTVDGLDYPIPQQLVSRERMILRDFGEPLGVHPRKVLEEFFKTRGLAAELKWNQISPTDYSSRHSVQISWSNNQNLRLKTPSKDVELESVILQDTFYMRGVSTTSRSQSEAYISVVVLFSIVNALGTEDKSFLKMSPAWRELYREFESVDKEQAASEIRDSVRRLKKIVQEQRNKDKNEHLPKGQEENDQSEDISGISKNTDRKFSSRSTSSLDPESLQNEWHARASSSKYKGMLHYRTSLPIFEYRHEILSTIQNYAVTIICGETGCGKSTQLPSYILEDALERGVDCKILCTEPRRISAVSLAQRVSEELGEARGCIGTSKSYVGYAIRLESKFTSHTRLIYATVGVVLRMLETNRKLEEITHLIVDEVHERSIDTDFLLIVIKSVMIHRPCLKLILMSATVDAQRFSRYLNDAPVVTVPGRTFPVMTKYLEDALQLTEYKATENTGEDLYIDTDDFDDINQNSRDKTRISTSELDILDKYDEYRIDYDLIVKLIEKVAYETLYSSYSKAFLVFLPGIAEIRKLHSILRIHPRFDHNDWQIYPLHSSISSAEQQSVFEIPSAGRRKIVIATNIAETGVTIPDITCVIDSGKHKEMRFDERRQMSRLIQSFVSKANATQRRGRAGRVQEGLCFHLFTKIRHDKSMAPQQTPEMLRLSLQELVMRTKIYGLGSIEETLTSALDPPSHKNIHRAIDALIEVGALTPEQNLTPLGQQLAKFPLDAQLGKLILYSITFNALDPALTIAAILSSKSPFVTPFDSADEAQKKHQSFSRHNSDLLSAYSAYQSWKRLCQDPILGSPTEFCRRNFLSAPALSDIEDLKVQLLQSAVEAGVVFLTDNEKTTIRQPRKSRSSSQTFISVPHKYNLQCDNDFLTCSLIASAFYPRILAREGKGWRNIATNQNIAPHPKSIARIDSPLAAKCGFFSYHSVLQASTRPHAMELSPASPIMLILLSANVEFDIASGLVVLDSGRVKWKARTWEECVALKYLHKHTNEILRRSFESPLVKPDTKLSEWREVIFKVFEDANKIMNEL